MLPNPPKLNCDLYVSFTSNIWKSFTRSNNNSYICSSLNSSTARKSKKWVLPVDFGSFLPYGKNRHPFFVIINILECNHIKAQWLTTALVRYCTFILSLTWRYVVSVFQLPKQQFVYQQLLQLQQQPLLQVQRPALSSPVLPPGPSSSNLQHLTSVVSLSKPRVGVNIFALSLQRFNKSGKS